MVAEVGFALFELSILPHDWLFNCNTMRAYFKKNHI